MKNLKIILSVLLFSFALGVANAATINVTTTTDELNEDGDCSLREAVQAANTNDQVDECEPGSDSAVDEILLQAETYNLAIEGSGENDNQTGDFDLRGDIKITGDSAGGTVIDANQLDRIFTYFEETTQLTLENLTIQNGLSSSSGGALLDGGDIIDLVIKNCQFLNNQATFHGGAADFDVSSGSLRIEKTRFEGNIAGITGGAFSTNGFEDVVVSHSSFINNQSGRRGGAIFSAGAELVRIETSLFHQNSVLRNDAIPEGGGGAISNESDAEFIINNSTFTENTCTNEDPAGECNGGAILTINPSQTIINHSSFVNNSSNGMGQTFFASDALPINVVLKNSLVVQNSPNETCVGSDFIKSLGFNLFPDDTCSPTATDQIVNAEDVNLGELEDNGGPTMTHALLEGSVAIGAGNCLDQDDELVLEDQRGVLRPQAACDIGAFQITCGDGVVSPGEACDDGNTSDKDGCDSQCVEEESFCGDGIKDAGEECDDGNDIDDDACSNLCVTQEAGDGGGCALHPIASRNQSGLICLGISLLGLFLVRRKAIG